MEKLAKKFQKYWTVL